MATTRSRPRGREHARPSSGGVAAEHATKIWSVTIAGIVVIVAFLTLTGIGHVIDAATQHFMLFYAGAFALIALCASVGLGLVATDRMFLNPGHRVLVQAAHRAASFGAVAFLIVHIITEILAQRVHMIDAVVPFLSPFRTFYMGIGTIASDLVILVTITSIVRRRFITDGKAWRWRAIHYTSYASLVFGVWHGLLGGRAGKPYVDWSYGFVVAFVAIGLAVRVLSNSLRPKENLSRPPVSMSDNPATAPLRAAAAFAKIGTSRGVGNTDRLVVPSTAQPVLSAPVADHAAGPPVLTAMPSPAAPGDGTSPRQLYYEPGYEGPARYLGAPTAGTGPQPNASTGPLPNTTTGPMPRAGTGPMPRAGTGPMPRAGTGPMPRPGTGPMPRPGTGPMPQSMTGPMPRAGTGPMPRPGTGPMPRAGTGSFPQSMTGPMPRAGTGPMPRPGTGPMPRPGTGPMPRAGTGPMPQAPRVPMAGPGAGPVPPGGMGSQGRHPYASVNGSPDQVPAPWDGGVPESNPALRYRDPGPGMPGYRGSRDQRYGGDMR